MRSVARGASLGVVLLSASVASGEGFWRDVLEPNLREFNREIRRGIESMQDESSENPEPKPPPRAYEEALRHFDRAAKLRPRAAEGHYWRGYALDQLDRQPESISALHQARSVDVDGEFTEDIAAALGIALMKHGDFEGAIAEHRIAISEAVTLGARTVYLSNSAEAHMTLGRLPEAISQYEEAIVEARDGDSVSRTLAEYGLAVALDRDDQRSRALETMRQGVTHDPILAQSVVATKLPAGMLNAPNVFFVPQHEVHYYIALQLEARAQMESDPALRRIFSDTSANEWQTFLSQGGAQGPWARQAREHAAALDRRHVPATAPNRRTTAPRGRLGR